MSELGFDENERGTAAFSSSNKRSKEETPIDRLSELPDSLLVHILSFLGVKLAGITSVLSKRWRFLWAELPRLEFWEPLDINYEIEQTQDFVAWVNRTLDIRKGNYLEEFRVRLMYDECFDSDVDSWIEFSVKNKAKRFSIMIVPYSLHSSWNNFYPVPQVMYSASSLTDLQLTRCIMASERKIEWQSLTSMFLREVKLDQRLMDEIVSNCPVLYDLVLEECWGFNRLEAKSRRLTNLRIEESERECYPEISAPFVCDLVITVHAEGSKCQVKDIPSVARAYIDFFEFEDDCTELVMRNAIEFLGKFKHVKKLLVGQQCFEILAETAKNGWQFPQSRLQELTLTLCSGCPHGLSGIIGLLESSPELETLLLEGYETEEEIVDLDPTTKNDLDGDLLHLRSVRVENFADPNGEPLLTLARLLLNRAPALEEMVILIDAEDTSAFINIAQKLLTYPRSSTKAQVHLLTLE